MKGFQSGLPALAAPGGNHHYIQKDFTMRMLQPVSVIRLCMGAGLVGGLVLIAGCDGGSAPEATQAETANLQKNEMAARQKAYGKSGVPNVNSAKAAKAQAASSGASAPTTEAPAN